VSRSKEPRLRRRTYFRVRSNGKWGPERGYRRVWQDADGNLHFLNESGVHCTYPKGDWELA
jgi:hypothetical protein